MRIYILFLLSSLFTFCYSQTNRNEDFVLKGIQAAKEQKFDLAISYLQFSLKDKNLPDSTKISGDFYLQYAYYNTNNSKFSIEKLDSIVPRYTNYKDSIATIFIGNMGFFLSQEGYYNKALEYGKQATKRIKELSGSQSIEYAYSLDNLANRFMDLELPDSAIHKAIEAGNIINKYKGINNVDYVTNLNLLSLILAEQKQYKNAIKYGRKAVQISKKIENNHISSISLDNLGNIYWDNGELQLGLKYIGKSLNILKNDVNHIKDYIIALNNYAQKCLILEEYDVAINCYKEALSIIEQVRGKDNIDYARMAHGLACSLWEKGEYESFCYYSAISYSIMKTISLLDNSIYYAERQKEIIDRFIVSEDYIRAKDWIEDILENRPNISSMDSIYYCSNLSLCYAKAFVDYKEAFDLHDKAMLLAYKNYDFQNEDDVISFLVLKCREIDMFMNSMIFEDKNSDKYKDTLKAIEDEINWQIILGTKYLEDNDPLLIEFYNLLISCYIKLDETEKAFKLNNRILTEKTDIDDKSKLLLLKSLSTIHFQNNNYKSAIKVRNESIKLLEKQKSPIWHTYYECLLDLAESYFVDRQDDMAIKTLDKRLSLLNKNIPTISILDNGYDDIYVVNHYLYLLLFMEFSKNSIYNNFAYDMILKFKNFKSETMTQIIGNSIYNESNVIYKKYVEFIELNRRSNILIERGEINKKELNSINKKIKQLEKYLLQESVIYANVKRLINLTWKDIQKGLHSNDVSIEFVELEADKYLALLLKSDWNDVKAIHFTIPKDITSETEAIKIWESIETYLSPGDNIYFSASGILHQIPIESLPIGDGKIMSDVYNMHRLSSTRELVKEKKEVKYTKAALYGGLNYDMTDNELLAENQTYSKNASEEYFVSRGLLEDSIRGYKWDKLSNTQQEVDYISDLMKKNQITTQTYKGNKGNEESFKALSGHEYNIIHLATHGFFYPDEEAKEKDYFKPMLLNDNYRMYNEVDMSMWRSGLVMSGGNRAWKGDSIPDTVEDGILKAQEIGDLDLRGADLVVLSACNTGQGEVTGEGVFGLQRAFKMAGAQTIVMSLTPVDDQTTMAMMNKFYTNLFSGQSKHDAFYNAQRYIRSIKPDPKYWMGWIMLD